MSMKKTDLEKHLAKKIAGESAGGRGGPGTAMNRREQALEKARAPTRAELSYFHKQVEDISTITAWNSA